MAQGRCTFCDTDEEFLIAKTQYSKAIVFQKPFKQGHFLVAPNSHKPSFTDISDDEARDLFSLANRLAKRIVPMLGADRMYLAAAGDTGKAHFHVHMLPKMPSDPGFGPYIARERGWTSVAGSNLDERYARDFVLKLKAMSLPQ